MHRKQWFSGCYLLGKVLLFGQCEQLRKVLLSTAAIAAHWFIFHTGPALPYFDNRVAVPDMLKKPYFDFDSRTPPLPQKENWTNPIIIRLFWFA